MTKITDKDIKKCYWNTYFLGVGWNYELMQGLGYMHSMLPVLDKVYTKKEDRIKVAEKYTEFFNTNPHVAPGIIGANIALVEEKPEELDAVSNLKLSLMGSLAAIGDTVLIAVFGSIVFALAAGIANTGGDFAWLAAFVPLLLFVIPIMIFRYKLHYKGYEIGKELFTKYADKFEMLKKYSFILGLVVIGALAATMLKLNLSNELMIGEVILPLNDQIESIIPGILVLLATVGSYKLLGMKKMNSTWLILIVFVVAIILGSLGILV